MRRDAKSYAQEHAKLVLDTVAGADNQLTDELERIRRVLKGVFPELEGQPLSAKIVGEIYQELAQAIAPNDPGALKTLLSLVEASITKQAAPVSA